MQSSQVCSTIRSAFNGCLWPHGPPEEVVDEANALQIAGDLVLYSDATQKYELPRLMCFVLEKSEYHERNKLICLVADHLDVEFDDPDGTNVLLRQTRIARFRHYSYSQVNAVAQWLALMNAAGPLDCKDVIDSAFRYWDARRKGQSGD